MWALHITIILMKRIMKQLDNKDEYIRAWAIQFLCEEKNPASPVILEWRKWQEETSPVVRLYLSAALQRIKETDRWDIGKGY